jgi:prolyl-tRNA synthetase
MGLKAIPMRADTGPIGGDLSHEFIILADTGESQVFCDKEFLELAVPGESVDFGSDAEIGGIVKQWTTPYAATDEMHDEAAWDKIPRLIAFPRAASRSAIFSTSVRNIRSR